MAVKQELDAHLQLRVPKQFVSELDKAAGCRMVNRTDYIRMALQDRIKADAVPIDGSIALWGV